MTNDMMDFVLGTDLHINMLTNTHDDTFWYADEALETPYNQDEAKAGDKFWDGNNGDKHRVLAVCPDRSTRRLLYRNLDQMRDVIQLAIWTTPFKCESYDRRRRRELAREMQWLASNARELREIFDYPETGQCEAIDSLVIGLEKLEREYPTHPDQKDERMLHLSMPTT